MINYQTHFRTRNRAGSSLIALIVATAITLCAGGFAVIKHVQLIKERDAHAQTTAQLETEQEKVVQLSAELNEAAVLQNETKAALEEAETQLAKREKTLAGLEERNKKLQEDVKDAQRLLVWYYSYAEEFWDRLRSVTDAEGNQLPLIALDKLARKARDYKRTTFARVDEMYDRMASKYMELESFENGAKYYELAFQNRVERLGESNPDTIKVMLEYAEALAAAGRLDESIQILRDRHQLVLARWTRDNDREPLNSIRSLADMLEIAGRTEELILAVREEMEICTKQWEVGSPAWRISATRQAEALVIAGRPDEAETVLRDILERDEKKDQPFDSTHFDIRAFLALTLAMQGKELDERNPTSIFDDARFMNELDEPYGSEHFLRLLIVLKRWDDAEPVVERNLNKLGFEKPAERKRRYQTLSEYYRQTGQRTLAADFAGRSPFARDQ